MERKKNTLSLQTKDPTNNIIRKHYFFYFLFLQMIGYFYNMSIHLQQFTMSQCIHDKTITIIHVS